MNLKKVYRLYREEGLAVRRRRGRKRAIGARAPLHQAQRPNQIWVLDFMSDVLETGRRFRVFNVEDQLTREGLAAEVDTSLPGPRVARALNRIVAERGKPEMIVSDNGTELTGNAMLKWAEDNRVEWHCTSKSRPAKVGDNLTTRDFGFGTRGFAASEDKNVVVCHSSAGQSCPLRTK